MHTSQRGMVTFELAVGLLTAAVVAALMSWAVSLVGVQTACADTAAQMTRQLARDDTAAANVAESRAPKGATVHRDVNDTTVTVRVDVDERWGRLGPIHLHGQAQLPREPV